MWKFSSVAVQTSTRIWDAYTNLSKCVYPLAKMDISPKVQEDLPFFFWNICMPAFIQSGCDGYKNTEIEFQVLFLNLQTWNSWMSSFQLNKNDMIEISSSYRGVGIFLLLLWSLAFYFIPCLMLTGVLHRISLTSPLKLFIFKINNIDSF